MNKQFVGIVGSGMMGRDPFDKHCWSRAGYNFFTTSQEKGVLARAFGVEVPMPLRAILMGKNFSFNKSTWRRKFHLDPTYYSYLTKEVFKKICEQDFEHNFLQIGGVYDVPSLIKGRSKVFSFHDGNIMELAKSPFFPEEHQKYVKRTFEWERQVYENMDTIFTYTQALRTSFIEDFNIPEHKVVSVGAGVNFEIPSSLNKDYERKEILFIGTAFLRKGGETLVNAFKKIYSKHPDAKLHIVGPKQKPDILTTFNCPGIIFHGFLSQTNVKHTLLIKKLFHNGTLGVLPSFYEPMGVALMECMAHGMPGIAPNKWGFSEFIQNGNTGEHAKLGDVNDLAEKIDLYLSDPDLRRDHGMQAREHISSYYTWDAVVDRIIDNMKSD